MKPVTILIVGAGNRGSTYAQYAADFPLKAKVVGVAEPRNYYRERLATAHQIPKRNIFTDWEQVLDRKRFADIAVIATQDNTHVAPAIALAGKGYHLLLEKPMAPSAAESIRIVEAVAARDSLFAVCHVLRYTNYTQRLKQIVENGRIGTAVNIQHLEPVGFFHQAHSFVRGNWGSSKKSSPMLLAKSCHDLDWIRYIMDTPCTHVSSFGSLFHFRPENKPIGASERCLDCSVAPDCPYDAQKIYLARAQKGESGWPLNTITSDLSLAGVTRALRDGPYGRCVYAGQNDVVDHQVVNMQFADGRSASFTMTGFTEMAPRQTRIFGTHGQISGDGRLIEIYDFLQEKREIIDTAAGDDGSIRSGHGGGDYGLMDAFIAAVAHNDSSLIHSGAKESLESHLMVFAAEKARLENRVVSLSEYGF